MTDLAALRPLLSGSVFLPDDEGFAAAALGFNLAIIHSPDAVVTAADIAQVVGFAAANGLPVRVQSTGHGAEAPIIGGILVSTSALDGASADASSKTAAIGAGAPWSAVVAAAAEHGLAPITGSAPGVGAVGFLTGGGLGPLARSFGFGSDYVVGFTVVTGTGEIVEATAEQNPDLLWALRGGKYGVGIVTEVRIRLVELDTLYGGSLLFAEEHIDSVARAWAEWTKSAPAGVSTSIAVLRAPDLDIVPPPLRGRTLLSLRFAYIGDAAEGERLAAPLRGAAPAYLDALGELAARDLGRIHNDPTDPGPGWASGGLLDDVDAEFMDTWLGLVGAGRQAPLVVAELRHLGGATKTDVVEGSAVGGRGADYSLTLVGAPDPALFATVVPGFADAVYASLAPWFSAETNINFIGAVRPGQIGAPWSSGKLDRLRAVQKAYDPNGVFA